MKEAKRTLGEPLGRSFIFEFLQRVDPSRTYTTEEINQVKIQISRDLHLSRIPRNSVILEQIPLDDQKLWKAILRTKQTRSLSGVVVVAVMTRPAPCPHGRCYYCPGGPDVGAPQSYTGCEPAALRALQNGFDPFLQVKNRLAQYDATGHPIDKLEIIIMGGTFPSQPPEYQEAFVKGCIDATLPVPSNSMVDAQKKAEISPTRISGITVETRPDICSPEIIQRMLGFGVTRFEIGVQTLYDDVYLRIGRGHTIKHVIEATRQLKDSGLKVCYHMMPNLPASSLQRDLEMFQELFQDPRFQPDMLKIYPLLILKGTPIYQDWLKGKITIYTDDEIVQLLASVSETLPPWVRIQRIQRDIPAPLIVAGPKKSNLGELVQQELDKRGTSCNCIRCREIGGWMRDSDPLSLLNLKPTFVKRVYPASEGTELFLSYEDVSQRALIGFVRLRIPSTNSSSLPILQRTHHYAFIRELHVYGRTIPVGTHEHDEWQHKGTGKRLLAYAEEIASNEYDIKNLFVTSGLGVRPYYQKLGYELNKPYMLKKIES